MNTHEIQEMLSRNEKTREYFLDVYAADQLPKTKIAQETWLLVCNCCPANLPGKHWIAMFGSEQDGIEVFDSFGLHPSLYPNVIDFLNAQQANRVRCNTVRLQSFNSDVCGHYCLYFAHHRSSGESMCDILEKIERVRDDARDDFIKYIVVNRLY